jgi:hypothetical protein
MMPPVDRRWLAIVAARQILIAWLFYSDAERYERGVSFTVLLHQVSIDAWVAIFAVAGTLAAIGVGTGSRTWGRVAILVSLFLSVYWTIGLLAVQTEARTASWLLAVIWGALMLKDANLAFGGLGVRQRPGD